MSGPKTNALRAGWESATLGDICDPPQYGWTTSASDVSNAVKLLRSTDISHGTVNWESVPFCETPPPAVEKYQLHAGDIVITRTGAGVGNSFLLEDCPPSVFASYLIRFKPHTDLSAKYIAYFLKGPSYRALISQNSAGIAQPNVNAKKLASLELPIAPRKTQDAIVAEIEKQFTRLDAAVAALRRVQANLGRYRAAVLKAACEGHLVPTEAELARHEGRPYESASVLLERTLVERRSRWVAAKKKSKYKDAPILDVSILPALSEGWEWAPLGAIAELKGGLTKGQKRKATEIVREVPYLRVANVQRGYLDMEEVKTIDATEEEITELRLEEGDVLFNEGGDRDKLGRGWVWEGKIAECVHQNHVFRARLLGVVMQPKLLSWYGNSIGQRYFEDEGKQTTNLASINMTKLSMLPVPIPPVAEQEKIVAELERRLSVVDEVDAEVKANLKRAERLRQAVLLSAFEGKLVPQDLSDEPASALLERIHAAREAAPKASLSRGRWKKEEQHVS